MSKRSDKKRQFTIHKRRKRREHMRQLREQWTKASAKERQVILEKFMRVAPHLVPEQYLGGQTT